MIEKRKRKFAARPRNLLPGKSDRKNAKSERGCSRLCCTGSWKLLVLQCQVESLISAHHGQVDDCGVEIDRQFGAGLRPEGEFTVAGEDHESDLFASRDNLIVGLERERHFVELS